jgi:hypothetical protein
VRYPFRPLSTAHLEPGQFWAIPLEHGRFACGRVIQLIEQDGVRDRRLFLAGLSSWCGTVEPSAQGLAGHSVLEQGQLQIKSIQEAGGAILGTRPLEFDSVRRSMFLDQAGGKNCMLLEGTRAIRLASEEDITRYAVLGTWGYSVPTVLAKKYFVALLGGA